MTEIFNKINIFVSFNETSIMIDKNNMNKLLKNLNIKDNKLILEIFKSGIINNNIDSNNNFDVVFDEVIEIIEVESSRPKVYDLTVEDTRNFTILGGLCVRDTFHSTGSGVKGM
jgi:intein/homing endonuclease